MKNHAFLSSHAALAAIACALAAPAHAQDNTASTSQATAPDAATQATTPDDIVVVGSYGEGLRKAMDKKRDSPVVIEALSISDLNQLPDVSVGDALARLPGLAAERDPNNGAQSQISIRGMGPQLALGLLNGRDLATTTPDRNIRYDQFPSELIGGAVVYKSPMASISEGGVAGSIDLSTVHPLDYHKNVLTMDLRGVYSQLGDKLGSNNRFGERGSISYIGRFAHDTLGIAIGYAGRSEPSSAVETEHAAYDPNGYTDFNGDGKNDNNTYSMSQVVRNSTDVRHGAIGVVEWKPDSHLHVTLDGLYSKVKIDGRINGLYASNIDQQYANSYANTVVQGNHVVAASVTSGPNYATAGLDVQDFAAISRRDDKLFELGGNVEWKNDRLDLAGDVAYSGVRYTADYYELRLQPVAVQNGTLSTIEPQTVTYDARSEVPTFGGVNFNTADPNIERVASLTLPFIEIGRDSIWSFKGSAVYHLGDRGLTALRFGVRYVDRTKSNDSLSDSQSPTSGTYPVLTASQMRGNPLGSYSGAQLGAAPPILGFDFYSVANQDFGGLHPYTDVASQAASWRVKEKTFAGYGQLDYAFGRFTGNIGVRVVGTRDTSSSIRYSEVQDQTTYVTTSSLTPYTVRNNYTDWLPSLNATFHATDELQFRFALAKTIARPAVDDLNAGFRAYGYGTTTAYGGNPNLQPFRADQADLTGEYYFGKNSYFSVSAFYKNLKTYITTGTQTVPFNGVDYEFFQPVNGHGGYIRGFEVTLQKQFDKLPAPFDGLGVYANYAFVDSDIRVTRNFSDGQLGLVGLSKHTATATAYYSKSGVDLRVSYNIRSPYARVLDGGGFETTDTAGYLDAQVSYQFSKGLSVVLQGSNLTNATNRTYLGDQPSERGRYEEFGRVFYAGFRAQF